jgi:vanillate O-demethylase ferredoxin subunit
MSVAESVTATPARAAGEAEPVTMRLTAITYAADQTCLFEFRPLDSGEVRPFQAGAHIDVHLPNGLIRQFSLTNSQDERHRYVVGVKKDPKSRGGSRYMIDELRVGTTLKIGGPRNNFPLNESAPHSILIAGGIGITPMFSMMKRLQAINASWELYYAVRKPAEVALAEELAKHGEHVHLHVDEEKGAFIDLGAIVKEAPRSAHLYCCGPTPMLEGFEAVTKSWPYGEAHVEHFTALAPVASEGGFIVELAKSGITIEVREGQTILEAVRAAGVDVPSSCEQGVCGACETRVLAGIPDHRDMILSPQEQEANDTMMICCSGCKSEKLVLDL